MRWRWLRCGPAEVRLVLRALRSKVESCQEQWNGQSTAMALYGLQGCSSDHSEAAQLVSVAVPQLWRCRGNLTSGQLGMALYGLQRMSSTCIYVRRLLCALASKLSEEEEELEEGDTCSGHSLSMALYGLQGCSSDSEEVREMVSLLAAVARRPGLQLRPKEAAMALFGLQGCSASCLPVQEMLAAIEPKLRACRALFSAQEVSAGASCRVM